MSIHNFDIASLLVCDVCDGEIMTPDQTAETTGCCAACGIAYDFVFDSLDEAVGC